MRSLCLSLSGMLLAGCTPVSLGDEQSNVARATDDAATSASDKIPLVALTIETTSWGKPFDRVSIAADGHARHEKWQSAFDDSTRREVAFSLSPAQHRQALAALAPLKARSGGGIGCQNMPTDGPYAAITWNNADKLDIYLPCLANPEYASERAAMEAFFALIADFGTAS